MIRIRLASFCAFSLAIAATPVWAETAPVAHVSYADLDLSSPAGMATVEHRVNGAIAEVCGTPSPFDLHALRLAQQCRRTAKADAETRVAMAVQAQQLARADSGSGQIASR